MNDELFSVVSDCENHETSEEAGYNIAVLGWFCFVSHYLIMMKSK